jgi:alkanesulfonate monooxygenase SsuD/methylene tetrahydromethanopterin reductase-like flavin-dependent oxidoreductase (luciferase family)
VARNRIAPVTAHSIATINQLAPGRVVLGFATGNTARRVMGMPPVGITDFRREVECIRTLLRAGTARYYEGDRESEVRLIHQYHGFVCLDPPVPVYVGANAPKALAVAGEFGDGLITGGSAATLRKNIARARAARPAGRSGDRFEVIAILTAYVTAPGEAPDSLAAREALGPAMLSGLRYALDNFKGPREAMDEGLAAFATVAESLPKPRHLSLYEQYFIGIPEVFRKFVTPEAVRAMATSGPPDYVAARVKELFAAGADEVVLFPLGNGRQLDNFRRFRETVIKELR